MRTPTPEDYDPRYTPAKSPAPEPVDLSDVVPIKSRPDRSAPSSPPIVEAQPDPPPERPEARADDRPDIRPDHRSEIRTEFRSQNLPTKRRTKRHSFEFYEDQLVRLKQLKIQAELAGEALSLSDMVRAALDDYLGDKDLA